MHPLSPRDAQCGFAQNSEGAWTPSVSMLRSPPRDLAVWVLTLPPGRLCPLRKPFVLRTSVLRAEVLADEFSSWVARDTRMCSKTVSLWGQRAVLEVTSGFW